MLSGCGHHRELGGHRYGENNGNGTAFDDFECGRNRERNGHRNIDGNGSGSGNGNGNGTRTNGLVAPG